jgi:hypothetical protein
MKWRKAKLTLSLGYISYNNIYEKNYCFNRLSDYDTYEQL